MDKIKQQLKNTLSEIDLPDFGEKYRGKVRDNFHFENEICMVTSDRVSAFDCVLGTIPFKGQILTEIANFWFDKTKDIIWGMVQHETEIYVRTVKALQIDQFTRG